MLTLVYYPPVVILWHRRLQSKRCCCPGLTERPTAVVPEGMSKEKKVDQEEPWQRLSGKTANGCCLLLACAGWAQEEPAGPVERFFEKLYIPVPSLPYICSKLGKQVLKPQVMSKQVGGLRIYALFLALLLLAVAIQGLAIA